VVIYRADAVAKNAPEMDNPHKKNASEMDNFLSISEAFFLRKSLISEKQSKPQ